MFGNGQCWPTSRIVLYTTLLSCLCSNEFGGFKWSSGCNACAMERLDGIVAIDSILMGTRQRS